MTRPRLRPAGFTLFEVLGVVFVTALVIGFTTNYYIELSRASNRASLNTREIRRGAAILDRIARDFEGALLLVKPPEVDPLFHPWLFLGESRYGDVGADHIKFVTRNHHPRLSDAREQDLALVAYSVVRSEEDDTLSLYRWSTPHLGDGLDTSFPNPDDEGSVLLAENLAAFGVTFYGEDGAARQSWDSTTLVESASLPEVVEISVSPADPDDLETALEDLPVYRRRVRLPVRPLDLAALIDPDAAEAARADDEADDEAGGAPDDEPSDNPAEPVVTASQCIDFAGWQAATSPGSNLLRRYLGYASRPWEDVRSQFSGRMFDAFVISGPGCN
ncbi:MAG: type II secretion system protein J [Myxococcota bacterium]